MDCSTWSQPGEFSARSTSTDCTENHTSGSLSVIICIFFTAHVVFSRLSMEEFMIFSLLFKLNGTNLVYVKYKLNFVLVKASSLYFPVTEDKYFVK